MKTAAISLALVSILAGSTAACTEQAHDVDIDSALQTFRSPTGSFTKDSGSSAFSSYRSEHAESSKVSTPGAGAGGSGASQTQSIRFLTKTASSQAQCAEGEKCSCDYSGSFTYALEQRDEGQALRFKFDSCLNDATGGFDGEAVLLVTTGSLLGDVGASAASADDEAPAQETTKPAPSKSGTSKPAAFDALAGKNFLLAAKGSAIDGSKRIPIEFALISEGGYALLAVEVPDGKIVIGLAEDQSAIVKAKQGTFLCKPKGEGYSCTSKSGGEELDVTADTSAETSADAPSTKGSTAQHPDEELNVEDEVAVEDDMTDE